MSVSRKRLLYGGLAAFVVLVAIYGISTLSGAKPAFDAARLARVERGTMILSVVATGKIEPVSEVEIF